MRFESQEQEDYYRRCLMARSRCVDPMRNWFLVPPEEVISEYEKMCKKMPSATKKDLDYYEKKLNEFPEIKI